MERDLILNMMVEEIDRLGGAVDAIRRAKGGHRVIYWRNGMGGKIVTTVQAYSGDWRSMVNARSNIRREARKAVTA